MYCLVLVGHVVASARRMLVLVMTSCRLLLRLTPHCLLRHIWVLARQSGVAGLERCCGESSNVR